MATLIAEASLSSSFGAYAQTGFIPFEQGYIDTDGYIKANTISYWDSLPDSWDSWFSFQGVNQTIKWTAPEIDLGDSIYFTLNIETDADADVLLNVFVSETGAFAGEETASYIENGNYNVEAFYGRYVRVTAITNSPVLRRLRITTGDTVEKIRYNNVDTTTLSGSAGARVLDAINYSRIVDMRIFAQAPTAYDLNMYVSDFETSQVLIPIVKSKSTASPTFGLYGIDNEARDGVVDIEITALPRMVMFNSNLTVI